MKFIGYATWDADQEKIIYGPQGKPSKNGVWHQVFQEEHGMAKGEFTFKPRMYTEYGYSAIVLEAVAHDILANTLASVKNINETRALIEAKPVQVDGLLLDIDYVSEQRISDVLFAWEEQERTNICWTMGDNTKRTFTKEQFSDLVHKAKIERAKRSARLHAMAENMKNGGVTSLRDLETWKESE